MNISPFFLLAISYRAEVLCGFFANAWLLCAAFAHALSALLRTTPLCATLDLGHKLLEEHRLSHVFSAPVYSRQTRVSPGRFQDAGYPVEMDQLHVRCVRVYAIKLATSACARGGALREHPDEDSDAVSSARTVAFQTSYMPIFWVCVL